MKKDYPIFDTSRLNLLPLSERRHDLDLSVILPLASCEQNNDSLTTVTGRIVQARNHGAPVVLMMGAHVLRSGVQRYIIDLMEKGFISCIAMNGACAIHDYEFALIGKTTENVSNYIRAGQFGLWQETGHINRIVKQASYEGIGLGEAVGREIVQGDFPNKEISIFAAGYRLGVLLTVHVGIGYDVIHEHPDCDGAAYGATSYRDFLRFAKIIESLQNGVIMNFGSAVMAPEIYLKALSMARNVAIQNNRQINNFTALVCDLYALPKNFHSQPSKQIAGYYFRPWKTMLVRTVADGGESYYVQASHNRTIPELWTAIQKIRGEE
ncbi:hypothetical protein QUF75_20830 [Desulfococcaceae bacterium HSG7]|nr:hypothetical protein [Desulfococcaceae bacterium HSG7]